MQKVILLIGMMVVGNIILAQEKHSPTEGAGIRLEKIKERLELSDDQVNDWKEVKEKYRPELKEIREDETKNKPEKMRAAADVMEKQEADLAAFLSEDQFAELQIIREEAKRKHKNKRKRGN